jgi:glycosyltransferase involved in cell wall biosynthesis
MKLFINASNLRFGGGKTVGLNIINYYIHNPDIEQVTVVAPAGCGYERFKNDQKVKIIYLPKIFNVSVFKLISNYILLPWFLMTNKVDFVLSLGNVAFPTRKPQFLLIHQPFLAYPESVVWERLKADDKQFYFYISNMLRFIKSNLKYASIVGVQTEAMRSRMHRLYNIPLNRLHVIPNAISFTSQSTDKQEPSIEPGKINLLFLSKYYPHKNFEILYEVGKVIADKKLPIRISVTIDPAENAGSKRFIEHVAALELDNHIVNIGNVPLEKVSKVYKQHDGLFLPTFLESFSGTYIEAMHFGKPVFTSDMDFAHEVCNNAAYYFNQVDVGNIVNTIVGAFEDKQVMYNKIAEGQEIIKQSKTWDDIGKFIDKNILNLN